MTASAIGYAAAMLTVASFVPQALKIWRTRQTEGLATPMWILSTTAFALWTTYGIYLDQLPIIIPNAICFALAGLILAMRLRYRRTRERRSSPYTRPTPACRST